MRPNTFRNILFSFIASVAISACGASDDGSVRESDLNDMTRGPADAPAVLVEYASTTCPACAAYHELMGDTIKQYADEGKLRFVFREYPRDAVDIAGFTTARCAGDDKYFDVLDDLFKNQQGLAAASRNGSVRVALQAIAQRHGVDAAKFEACLDDETIRSHISNAQKFALSQGVGGTPALYFNGAELSGAEARTPESLLSLIENAQ